MGTSSTITLNRLAADFGFDAGWLKRYANEDTLLGNDWGNPYGTSYTVEGNILYALVRALKPDRILEIGTHHGGSAAHMAAACMKNKRGTITTIDINPEAGQHIPAHLQPLVMCITVDATLFAQQYYGQPYDFIFEDGNHSEGQVHTIYEHLPALLRPGGWILSHDAAMEGVGDYIRNGQRKGGVNLDAVKIYITPPSPCGLTVYQFEEISYATP